MERCQQILLDSVSDSHARARLLAAFTKESSYWLEALPSTSLGLHMDDSVIRIATGLHLGLSICTPHALVSALWYSAVDELGTHGLSYRKSQGRHPRHGAANDFISHAFTAAGPPSHLEPSGLCLSNIGRPDGDTLVPWKCGRLLTWDFTCPDTLATHVSLANVDHGVIAAEAENRKMSTYSNLQVVTLFSPIAVKRLQGLLDPIANNYLGKLAHD